VEKNVLKTPPRTPNNNNNDNLNPQNEENQFDYFIMFDTACRMLNARLT